MSETRESIWNRAGVHCRRVAVLVIAGVWRSRSFAALDRRAAQLPLRSQVAMTLSVLGFLLALALVAAQFGPVGLALYFVGVVLLVR
jgi:hypothetical protein